MTIGGITLPNPEWSDSRALKSKLHYHRMMGGAVESYIESSPAANWRRVTFQFSNVDYVTVQELLVYLKAQAGDTITVVDHNGVTWTAYQTSNPLSVVWDNRGHYVYADEDGGCSQFTTVYHNERGSFTFEFEGTYA